MTKVAPTIELPLSALLEKDGSDRSVDRRSADIERQRARDQGCRQGAATFTVAEGLEAGMRVVTAGVHSLAEGQKVRVLEGGAT